MQQVDLHTHNIKNNRSIQILNIFAQDLPVTDSEYVFSSGIHPWHIGNVNQDECLHLIEGSAKKNNMLAIGECGLDRSISIPIELQQTLFQKQVRISEEYSKPIIIHCVRAFSDLLNTRKKTKSQLPWILHGYTGNKETTQNLTRQGFYFSIGLNFLRNQSKHDILRLIPYERLFLETDDSELPIENIYILAAQILNVDIELLSEVLFNNFKRLFENGKMATKN